jgi:hypothetical protein
MTQDEIKSTIDALRKTTAKATKSKVSAIRYLVELGLIENEKPIKKIAKRKK